MTARALVSPAAYVVVSLVFLAASAGLRAQKQAEMTSPEERAAFHQDPQWAVIAPHLPNPDTASGAELEMAADVLRARRFPEDALDYYGYAIARGAPLSEVLNKMGILRMELRQYDLARELFLRTVRAKKNDASAWNNLGVIEYIHHQYRAAIADYRRAAKIDKKSSVYHSNIGMAYFDNGDVETARREFAIALQLDPHTFEHRGEAGGNTAHIVGTQNYPHFAFEMARVYAKHHDDENTILWLSKATEAGYDTKAEMGADSDLSNYLKDPRVIIMLKNAQQLRSHTSSGAHTASLGPAPAGPHPPEK